jgi:hypothetical protein
MVSTVVGEFEIRVYDFTTTRLLNIRKYVFNYINLNLSNTTEVIELIGFTSRRLVAEVIRSTDVAVLT